MKENTEKKINNFYSKINIKGKNECWEWMGGLDKRGYGKTSDFIFDGKIESWSHRISYSLSFGRITHGMDILHSCDNPSCCNPNHLREGTHQDNMTDMATRGRWNGYRGDLHYSRTNPEKLARGDRHGSKTHPEKILRGESNKNSRLTQSEVDSIRQEYVRGKFGMQRLANKYNTSKRNVLFILQRKHWK